jgi:serine/threonine protein phosphatase PrpC
MSFISKLFRKTDVAETPEDQPAPTAPSSDADTARSQPEQQADTEPRASEAPAAEAASPTAPDSTALEEQAAPNPPSTEPADNAWWEESTPPQATPAHEWIAPPIEEATAATPAAPATQAANGTQPLHPEVAEPVAAEPTLDGELEGGTRPLTAADTPMLAALRSHRGLAVAAQRDIGRVRSINQDSIFALTTTLPRESGDVSMGLFIVADGMGGHHGGEIASRLAISTVAHYVLAELVVPALTDGTTEALQPLIIAAVQEANRAIWEHAQTVGSDMGTTCTVALLLGRALYLGHVGDSRAYLVMPNGLKQITNDHSTVGRLIQVGQLDPAEAREHPLRSQLYRTVGQQPEVMVDFTYQQVGDATHLLMGSDGLWGMLDDEIMFDAITHSIWPQDACNELIARANLAGGEDNISAIVVSLPTQP